MEIHLASADKIWTKIPLYGHTTTATCICFGEQAKWPAKTELPLKATGHVHHV